MIRWVVAVLEILSAPPAGSVAGRLLAVAATFATLAVVGFGFIVFGKPQLEIVASTAKENASRAFAVGVLTQILAAPLFVALVIGLALSVVGVLLIPFVLAVFTMLLGVAVLGGFLSVVHGMGETLVRRQMLRGKLVPANSYRYLLVGLGSIVLVWIGWALFRGVPVAGALIGMVAAIASWVPATIGLGAAILSRGGAEPGFTGRYLGTEMLTDEYLWATPQRGVQAVKRPPKNI